MSNLLHSPRPTTIAFSNNLKFLISELKRSDSDSVFKQFQNTRALFHRFIYKSKNQHHQSKYFQKLMHIRRLIDALAIKVFPNSANQSVNGKNIFCLSEQLLHDSGLSLNLPSAPLQSDNSIKNTLSHELLSLLNEAVQITSALSVKLFNAYTSIRNDLVKMTFFMPFGITMCCMLARLTCIAAHIGRMMCDLKDSLDLASTGESCLIESTMSLVEDYGGGDDFEIL